MIDTIGSLSDILFIKLFPKPQHIGAIKTKRAPVENLKLLRSSLDKRTQAIKTTTIPIHSLGDIFCLKINKATNEVITISKLLRRAALEADINLSPSMLQATPIALRAPMAKTKGKSLFSRVFSFIFGLTILRKMKKMPAQRAAPKYKSPPEITGPIVLLFNNNLDIGVLIDEQTAAIIAKIIPILALLFMGKV